LDVSNFRPLAVMLPRQPGSREARYAHLLGGPVEVNLRDSASEVTGSRGLSAIGRASETELASRISELAGEIAALRAAVARIEDRLESSSSSNR